MAQISNELSGAEYHSLNQKQLVEWFNSAMEVLTTIGKENRSEKEKFFIQFAYDVMNMNRNNVLDNMPKKDEKDSNVTGSSGSTVIVPTSSGTLVRGRTGLKFRT